MIAALARARRVAGAVRRAAMPLMPPRTRPAILMYHRIAEDTFDPWELAVAPHRFEAQMDWLSRHRTVQPLSEFLQLHQQRRLPPDATVLTFDDGYGCVAELAFPVLDRLGLAATVFLPVAIVERGAEFWWDELRRIVFGFSGETLDLDGEPVPLGPSDERDAEWRPGAPPGTPRQQAFHRIWASLRTRPPKELEAGMRQLRTQGQVEVAAGPVLRPMTPDQMRAASDRVEFGSHGLTHPFLPGLDDKAKTHEVHDSRSRCAALTGAIPRTFAYPYGDHDDATRRLVEEAGYEGACTTRHAFVRRDADRLALPRLAVGDWDLPRFRRMIGGRA